LAGYLRNGRRKTATNPAAARVTVARQSSVV